MQNIGSQLWLHIKIIYEALKKKAKALAPPEPTDKILGCGDPTSLTPQMSSVGTYSTRLQGAGTIPEPRTTYSALRAIRG